MVMHTSASVASGQGADILHAPLEHSVKGVIRISEPAAATDAHVRIADSWELARCADFASSVYLK